MSLRTTLPPSLSTSGISPTPTRVGSGITYQTPSPAVQQQPAAVNVTPMAARSSPMQPAVEIAAPMYVGSTTGATGLPVMRGFCLNPMMIIVLMLIFIVVFIILLSTKSNMVTDLVNGERVINNGKLIFWTVFISIIISVVALVIAAIWRRSGK